ncbi:MAG: DUF883 family protein [Thiobacillus sp.]|nr:DUF883 family protein [Thiobacillus sp.]
MSTIEMAMEKSMEKVLGEVTKEQLITDFKVVVADAEALLKATASQGGEKMAEVRAKAEESLRIAKDKMAEAQAALLVKTKEAARATDVYVHENPWRAIGAAAGVGLVIGLLIGRR